MQTCKLIEKCSLDVFEQVSLIIGAMIHDLDHPGFNNMFLV